MTVEEVAAKLEVSTVRVYQYINLGLLPAEKFGRQWAIEPEVLAAFKRRPTGRPPIYKVTRGRESWRVPAYNAREAKEKVQAMFEANPPGLSELRARREKASG